MHYCVQHLKGRYFILHENDHTDVVNTITFSNILVVLIIKPRSIGVLGML